mgnify:CR=1 FL=1
MVQAVHDRSGWQREGLQHSGMHSLTLILLGDFSETFLFKAVEYNILIFIHYYYFQYDRKQNSKKKNLITHGLMSLILDGTSDYIVHA